MVIAAGVAAAGAALTAGATIYGSSQQASAAGRAAETQADAAEAAAAMQLQSDREGRRLQLRMFRTARRDLTPYRQVGRMAVGQLREGMKPGGQFTTPFEFEADPGYAFRIAEGQRALEHSASARGMQLSGAQGRALTRYGQEMGSDEYGRAFDRFQTERTNRYNRLAGLAGTGQVSATQSGQAGINTASNIAALGSAGAARAGDFVTQGANARASGYLGAANAINQGIGGVTNTINSGLNTYLTLQALQRR